MKLRRNLSILLASCGLAVVATPAQAVNVTYKFTGDCIDCGATTLATGLLTLSDYTLGDALSVGNLVSFTYFSANYPSVSFDSFTDAFGTLNGEGANDLAFTGTVGGDFAYFGTNSDIERIFNFIIEIPQDTGGNANWTLVPASVAAVPEPAAWALMMLGFGMVGAALRRRKVTAATA